MTSAPQADAAQRFNSGPPLQPVSSRPDISILVPAKDEAENLPLFMEQAHAAFASVPQRYEVIVIDDGSVDDSWNVLQELASKYPFLRPVRHGIRRGIADSLRTGYLHSRGSILAFYPADLQYKPEDIPRLVAPIVSGESDIVTGYKEGKYEKAFVSGIYNKLSRSLFKMTVRDLNSVKAYRRGVEGAMAERPAWGLVEVGVGGARGVFLSGGAVALFSPHTGKVKGLER